MGFEVDKSRFHPTSSDRYYGFARVKVTPNKSDLIGLLPQRDVKSGRLYFPVYPMEGCWGTEEIYLAMQNGYIVEEIFELYFWDERNYSNLHFAAYVNYFFQLKQEAEGWKKLGGSSENPGTNSTRKSKEKCCVKKSGKIIFEFTLGKICSKIIKNAAFNYLWNSTIPGTVE